MWTMSTLAVKVGIMQMSMAVVMGKMMLWQTR
jgi:hypothetical protein